MINLSKAKYKKMFIALGLTWLLNLPLTAANHAKTPRLINTAVSPSTSDWKAFWRLSESQRESLYKFHQKQKTEFKDWSWEWRIGWVKSCTSSDKLYCRSILKKALFDPALVVRSTAVDSIATRFQASHSPIAVSLLKAAYKHPENYRHAKPLYIQNHILFALKKVGGAEALGLAGSLALAHSNTKEYWKKISTH